MLSWLTSRPHRRKDLILVVYCDDAFLPAPKEQISFDFIKDLKSCGFDVDSEGPFASYLGFETVKQKDGSSNMLQKGPINKVISDLRESSPLLL